MSVEFSQSGLPRGVVGHLVGWIMRWHNHLDNKWTISLLKATGKENILEVGFGPGQAIKMLAEANAGIQIAGVEHSETMLKVASRLNREAITAGRVDLRLGKAEHLPFDDASFDKVFSVNCIYFWKSPITGLRELHRVLKSGGCVVITVRDSDDKSYETFQSENLTQLINEADFSSVTVCRNNLESHPLLAVIAVK